MTIQSTYDRHEPKARDAAALIREGFWAKTAGRFFCS